VVTSVVWDMWPTVEQVISLVQADVFTSQDFGQCSFMGKGGSFLAPYHVFEDKLSDEIKTMVEEKKAEILSGNFRVEVDESAPTSE
jgi:basic membrane lipoprotein Med (substrate-binding protein (PBP1-ABC) superfamily)